MQKDIWIQTGNRLGIKQEEWRIEDYNNYLRFSKAVGWYDDKKVDKTTGSRGNWVESKPENWVEYDDLLKRIKDNPFDGYGSLPLVDGRLSRRFVFRVSSRVSFFWAAICKL